MTSEELRSGVRDLCAAVRELLDVFDLQHAQAEAARERAEASRAVFDRMMESYRSGTAPPAEADPSRSLYQALRSSSGLENVQEEIRSSAVLSRRWETGFCDLYEALIRLNAHPELRAAVTALSALVRTIRLMQVTSEEEDLPLPPAAGIGEELNLADFRESRSERILSFTLEMDDPTREVGETLMGRLTLTRGHLETLLDAAEALSGDPEVG